MRHSARTNYFVPHGAIDEERAVTAVWEGNMNKTHHYRVGSHSGTWDDLPTDPDELDSLTNGARKHIEPWLSAVFQAEHLNLLLGSGFTTAVGCIAGVGATGMANSSSTVEK